MNDMPKISILIPVYNVEKYIARCLESLFTNTIIDKCEIIDDETRALIDAHKRIFAKYGNSRFSVVVGRLCYLCIRFRYGGIRKTVRYYARIIRGNRNEK